MSDASDLARFLAKVEFAPNGCWLWTASKRTPAGYGQFQTYMLGSRRPTLAHRWLYAFLRSYEGGAELAPDKHLDHLCRTPRCVNPNHLEPVTPAENNRRAHKSMHRQGDGLTRLVMLLKKTK